MEKFHPGYIYRLVWNTGFDIVSYYPSIKNNLLSDTLQWAENFTIYSSQEQEVLDHARKLYLSQNGEPWVNKNDLYFDVPRKLLMEQRLLSKLENLIDHTHIGLYKDDGLAVVNLSGV